MWTRAQKVAYPPLVPFSWERRELSLEILSRPITFLSDYRVQTSPVSHMMCCTKKMGICNSCVGLRAIDLTLRAPYLRPAPSSSWALCISWSCIGAPPPKEGGWLFHPSGDVKGGLWSATTSPAAWMNTVIVWLKCEWLACVCVGCRITSKVMSLQYSCIPLLCI